MLGYRGTRASQTLVGAMDAGSFTGVAAPGRGRQPSQWRFQSAEVVHRTADVFAGGGEAHPILIDIPPEIPLVFADPEIVRQVISNLVSNALKYSPEGAPVRIGDPADPGQVLVWVSDDGIGIPSGLLSKIFSRFYRVDNTATRKIGGTGLGLALVKDIVEAHGGRVWAESTLRKGSTFYFTLKVAEQDDLAA